jgi:hypothetical protein
MNRSSKFRPPYATIVAFIAVIAYYIANSDPDPGVALQPPTEASGFALPAAGGIFEAAGVVQRILADDIEGSRHQRFIVVLPDGHTLLIAHNIDLAPRIDDLKTGDAIRFRGEFEPNERGGVVHWTHHDPRGEHPAGWLEHEGRRYE